MIRFKELRWSNAFSYGKDNVLRLDAVPLTQLVGKNGNGKSSVALVIEEILYNQNSKKIKKADILNRYIKDKNYTIELDFNKDGAEYTIKTTRTVTSGSVSLFKDGVDISNHTSTGTYKNIEYIIGYDHKTFSQIVYQSSVSSLEFLTATDTARKKFLIELLNLTKYTKANEVFKDLASNMSKSLDILQAKIATVSSWIAKYSKEELVYKQIEPVPVLPTNLLDQLALLSNDLKNVEYTNKKISQNNTYKQILANIEIGAGVSAPTEDLTALKIALSEITKKLKDGKHLSTKHTGAVIKCVTCSQDMDNSVMFNMAREFESTRPELEFQQSLLSSKIAEVEGQSLKHLAHIKNTQEWEKYHALVDTSISSDLLDKDRIAKDITVLKNKVDNITKDIYAIEKRNTLTTEHNSKVKVITEQMQSMKVELSELNLDLSLKVSELANLQILVKAFSTTGLVAYKIECLVKDLESITNEYLLVLADGRFQLGFKITSSDKLNVVITDNSKDVDILALSSGERARVNVATLLAIRKLMQSLSNSRTNLLILDETVENLDAEGKERLIEVLLAEDSLNTFLISHGFSHPLLDKISIVKDNNISRIE
jgi:DNA repair exonuclease SbcCD ATPase subunit